jgi:hypothetical protein
MDIIPGKSSRSGSGHLRQLPGGSDSRLGQHHRRGSASGSSACAANSGVAAMSTATARLGAAGHAGVIPVIENTDFEPAEHSARKARSVCWVAGQAARDPCLHPTPSRRSTNVANRWTPEPQRAHPPHRSSWWCDRIPTIRLRTVQDHRWCVAPMSCPQSPDDRHPCPPGAGTATRAVCIRRLGSDE